MKDNKINLKNTANFILLFLITAIVLYFSLKDNFNEIIGHINNANIFWILVSIFLFFGSIFLRSLSLHDMIAEFKKDFKIVEAFKLALKTQFFNAVTPFATGGQPFQIYTLKQQGLSLTSSANVIVQNFIVYQIALVLLGAIAIVSNRLFNIFPANPILKSFVVIGFLINAGIVGVLFLATFAKKFNKFVTGFVIKMLHRLKIVKDKEKTINAWEEYINNFSKGAKTIISNKKLMIRSIGYNFFGLAAFYIVPLTVAYSLGYYYAFNGIQAIFASAYVMIMGSFVPMPGGSGGIEYGFVAFFSNFITGSALSAILIIWRTVTYYIPMIAGALTLYIKGD